MKKAEALEKINVLLQTVDTLLSSSVYLTDGFYQWQIDTEMSIRKMFGDNHRYLDYFLKIDFITKYATSSENYNNKVDGISHDGLKQARAILESMKQEIQNYWNEKNYVNTNLNTLDIIERICDRFHLCARQLTIRYSNRNSIEIQDEYDVQDLFHALLNLYFDDIRKEEWNPSYAGKSSRSDFLLKQEQTVIEIKKTRPNLTAREVGEQLILDVQKYQSHPDCKTLICFVYDPDGIITNPRGIENDLSKTNDSLVVKVFIRPK